MTLSFAKTLALLWNQQLMQKPVTLSYQRECQEKNLPFGSVPKLFFRHSAQLFERAPAVREWSCSDRVSCFVSMSETENGFLSPVVPFHFRDGAIRFLKRIKPDGYPPDEWQRMVLSEARGLWLFSVVRGGIGLRRRLGARRQKRSLTMLLDTLPRSRASQRTRLATRQK